MRSNPKTSAEFENFLNFVRGTWNVSGTEVKKRIEQEKQERAKKKRAKTSPASHASNDREH
jgi:hypothetical protein